MTSLLVKLFVKDSEQIRDGKVRERYGILASIVGVCCNAILFAVKFIVGTLIHSVSVTADAFNNLSDAASSVVSFFGAKLANRPADDEHPFGHGRYEYVTALVVAFLVFEVGISCLKDAVDKIRHPEAVGFSMLTVTILIISVLIKLWLGLFNRKLGKKIDSTVMKATAADSFGDMLVTTVTTVSIIVGHFTGWAIDGYMGLVVSLFVLYAGIGIVRETLVPLIGAAASTEEYGRITAFVEQSDLVLGIHDLIVHNYGPTNTMATIHAEVSADGDIQDIHEEIDRIEAKAKNELGVFLVIHMDPIESNNSEVVHARQMAELALAELDRSCSLHDFRMVNGERQVNLIFDLVVPRTYDKEMQRKILHSIREKMKEQDEKYACVITVEHSFVKNE